MNQTSQMDQLVANLKESLLKEGSRKDVREALLHQQGMYAARALIPFIPEQERVIGVHAYLGVTALLASLEADE